MLDRLKSNAAKVGLEPHDVEVLEDIIIENVQCCREAEMYANILNSLMDARASIVSNNLNVLMKTLSAVALAIMLVTLVVSVFSMNVDIPLEHHPHAFVIILAFAACSVVGLVLFWRLRGW
jgi:magnesium transporter